LEWLGELPAHWEVKQLRHLGEAIIGLTYDPADLTDEHDRDGILVLRSSNVQRGRIVFEDALGIARYLDLHGPAKTFALV